MSSGPKNSAVFLVMVVAAIGAGALAFYVKSNPQAAKVPAELHRPENKPTDLTREKPVPPKSSNAETVRGLAIEDGKVVMTSKALEVPHGMSPLEFAGTVVLEAVNIDGAKVTGVDVRDHVAIVSFNQAIKEGMGSLQEGQFIQGLQIAYGQFDEIDKVWINVDGQPVDSIGEHIEVIDPLPVIRPGETAQPKPSAP